MSVTIIDVATIGAIMSNSTSMAFPDDEKTKYLFAIWTLKGALLKWLGSG